MTSYLTLYLSSFYFFFLYTPSPFHPQLKKSNHTLNFPPCSNTKIKFLTYQQQQDLLSAQLALADLAYKIGDLQQAQIQYLNALKLQPSFLPAKLNLASIYRETNQLEKSKELLQKILEFEENHAMALHNLGLIFVIEKQWPQALDALKRATEIEPANPRFAFVYILGLEAGGKVNEALSEVNKLQIKTPNDPALQELSKRLKKKLAL